MNVMEHFLEKVGPRNEFGCPTWLGSTTRMGYARFWIDGKTRGAHEVAYELFVGPIPEGKHLDHTCHTKDCKLGPLCPHRACTDPYHLEPVTPRINYERGRGIDGEWQTSKTHCPAGHPYDETNTRIRRRRNKTVRECRECDRIRHRKAA